MKKTFYSVVELDRVVKFLDGLNKLAAVHKIGLSSYEDIILTMDDEETPFRLDASASAGEALLLVVSL